MPGVALLAGGVLGLVWALVRGEPAGWTSGEVLGAAAVGLLLLAGFAVWERRAPHPLLPPRLLRVRGFAAGNAAIFLTFAALFSAVFFYGQLLQVVMAESPLGAGVRLMAWTGTFLVFAPPPAPWPTGSASVRCSRPGSRPGGRHALVRRDRGHRPDLPRHARPVHRRGLGVSLAIPCGQSAVRGRGRGPGRRDRVGRERARCASSAACWASR